MDENNQNEFQPNGNFYRDNEPDIPKSEDAGELKESNNEALSGMKEFKSKKEDNSIISDEDKKNLEREKAERIAKRARQEKERKRREEIKRRKDVITTFIFLAVAFLMIAGIYSWVSNMSPDKLFKQGKEYLKQEQWDKAYLSFKKVSNLRPTDENYTLYEVMALSKMPPTYEVLEELYNISQYDNQDKASDAADNTLQKMRQNIEKNIGPNYAGNAPYNDVLYRWNNKEAITYFIKNYNNSRVQYENMIKKAFETWSNATGKILTFEQINDPKNADILISLEDTLGSGQPLQAGICEPQFSGETLKRVSVGLKTRDSHGVYDFDHFYIVALHEIGHAIGIGGHSSNPNDIMYFNGDFIGQNDPKKSLSTRDINTIKLLYKMVPDVINKPIDSASKNAMFYHFVITAIPGEDFDAETTRLLEQTNKDIVAWMDLGINYGIKKQYQRSNAIFSKIVPLVNGDKNNQFIVFYNLATNYYKMRKYKEAEKYIQLAESINKDSDSEMLSAFIDLKLKRKTALDKLIALNKKYPDKTEIALKIAEIYYFSGDKKKAKETVENLVTVNPSAAYDKRVFKYRNEGAQNTK